MEQKAEHTTIRNQNLFCLNCGGKFEMTYPLTIEAMNRKIEGFNLLHADCKPVWKEPEANLTDTVEQRAAWWISEGEVGLSSKTIWHVFTNNGPYTIHHPHDPADFGRCYKLLKAIPEWRQDLHRMKPLSKSWSNLVDNWDRLTAMYEENERTGWANYKRIGMYEFMRVLVD